MPATTQRRMVTPQDVDAFADLRESGHTLCQIATMTGFCPATIHKHMGTTERAVTDSHLDTANHPEYGTTNKILMSKWNEAING